MIPSTAEISGAPKGPLFDVKEKQVRRGFGLSEDDVRALRQKHLTQGVHWEYQKRAVCYCAAGVEALRAAIVAGSQKNSAAPSAPATALLAPLKEEVPVTLIVYRAHLKNGRMILAHLPGADPDVNPDARLRVRVKRTTNFVRGMEIQGRPLDATGTLFELAGDLPRRKGRWPVGHPLHVADKPTK